ncbi:MAG: DUF423 domain-containing protein [Chloroflexota bacterium]
MEKKFFSLGAFFAGLAVATGSFGAHGLQKLVPVESLTAWEKAVRYQMYHAFALFFVAWAITHWRDQTRLFSTAGWAFVLGIALFSGSLYILSLTGTLTVAAINLAYITPAGGVAFVIGWLILLIAVRRA